MTKLDLSPQSLNLFGDCLENRSARLYSITCSQDGVPFESNEPYLLKALRLSFELVLRRPVEAACLSGKWSR